MILVLITIFALALQLNRQSSIWQEVALNQKAHDIVYHAGELTRYQSRLAVLLAEEIPLEAQTLTTYRAAINRELQRLTSITTTDEAQIPSMTTMTNLIRQYRTQWDGLQSALEQLSVMPADQQLGQELQMQLAEMDQLLEQLVQGGQVLYAVRLQDWIESLHYINQLLTGATVLLLVVVLLVTYIIYLVFRMQSRVEDELRGSAQRLQTILHTIPDAVLRLKGNGRIIDQKPADSIQPFTQTGDWLGKDVTEIMPEHTVVLVCNALQQALVTSEPQTIEYQFYPDITKTLHTFEARFLPTSTSEIQLLVRDITEEKQADAAALQAQKLESIGMLAGGIAHDFNNILTGLLAQTSLAKRKLERGLPAIDNLDKAILSTERAADLTRQLLAYAGRGKFQIAPLDLNQLIHDTATLLETVFAGREQLRLHLTDDLPPINADRGQIQQVVMNLVINAAEALANPKGNVTLTTTVRHLDPADLSTNFISEPPQPGVYILLEIRDNGTGMDQATLSRIFDPFYSTKATGHGLGLSATLGIIRTHHGGLCVKSQLGEGTTFIVLFPVAEAVEIISPHAADQEAYIEDYSKSILVIDDEAAVRHAVSDILTDRGYAVMTAAGGKEGIATYQAQRAAIGVVLLDMKMPGMSGQETYDVLREMDPALNIIFTSGYSETEITIPPTDIYHTAFLPKPYNADRLSRHVHQMMVGGGETEIGGQGAGDGCRPDCYFPKMKIAMSNSHPAIAESSPMRQLSGANHKATVLSPAGIITLRSAPLVCQTAAVSPFTVARQPGYQISLNTNKAGRPLCTWIVRVVAVCSITWTALVSSAPSPLLVSAGTASFWIMA